MCTDNSRMPVEQSKITYVTLLDKSELLAQTPSETAKSDFVPFKL